MSDLEPGMLLAAAGDNECFAIYGSDKRWLRVRIKPAYGRSMDMISKVWDNPVLYLGTKKDLSIVQPWTDKFVLVNNEVVGVDPSSWRRMKPVV